MGIASDPWRRGRLLGHGGRGIGYAASLSWVPEYQVGAVVLTNSEQGDGLAVGTVQRVLQEMIEAKYARRGPAKESRENKLTNFSFSLGQWCNSNRRGNHLESDLLQRVPYR